MIYNDDNTQSYNDYCSMPNIPYKIVEALIKDKSEMAENLWKLLKYNDFDCLSKDNLTQKEKTDLIWKSETDESEFRVFLKPLIGSSTESSDSQTQIRIYRTMTNPESQYRTIICYEFDLITNEKTCLVKHNGILVEKTDLMESILLQLLNGRDLSVGILKYDRQLTRSCNSQLSISNSKSFYGRSIVMALSYVNPSFDDRMCGDL